jgi:hypothetical protein
MANNTYTLDTWSNVEKNYVEEMNPAGERMSNDKALLWSGLNHKHMVETIERFEWKNLPDEIPSDLIERVLFFRFKGCLFYEETIERYFFLPFALKGEDRMTIDSYGRYLSVTPILFTGQWQSAGDGEKSKDMDFITDKAFDVVYDLPKDSEVVTGDYVNEEDEEADIEVIGTGIENKERKAVVLNSASLQISQDFTPMSELSQPYNEQLTDILVLVNLDLINSAKVFYIIAKDEAAKEAIQNEFSDLDSSILGGQRHFVATSMLEFKELSSGQSSKDSARYFQSYQSIDNLRKDLIGSDNGGTFLKQEHATEKETETNSNTSGASGSAVLKNALRQRKEFCSIVNKVWGLNIDVELCQSEESQNVEGQGAQTDDRQDTGGDQ